MPNTLLIALATTVAGQVVYHVVAKGSSAARSPYELIAGAYLVGCLTALLLGRAVGRFSAAGFMARENLIPAVLIGLAVTCVETGYLYAYRAGLPANTGALRVLALTTVVMVPISVGLFGEKITLRLVVGAAVTCCGIWMMSSKGRS